MQVTTLAEARALVGRTFERDGLHRTIRTVRWWNHREPLMLDQYAAGWNRPESGEDAAINMVTLRVLNRWLKRATEVTDA